MFVFAGYAICFEKIPEDVIIKFLLSKSYITKKEAQGIINAVDEYDKEDLILIALFDKWFLDNNHKDIELITTNEGFNTDFIYFGIQFSTMIKLCPEVKTKNLINFTRTKLSDYLGYSIPIEDIELIEDEIYEI